MGQPAKQLTFGRESLAVRGVTVAEPDDLQRDAFVGQPISGLEHDSRGSTTHLAQDLEPLQKGWSRRHGCEASTVH